MNRDAILEMARGHLNAINDDFWSDDELYRYLYSAEVELSNHVPSVIENTHVVTGSTSTSQYSIPEGVKIIKKMNWNGYPLSKITEMRKDAENLGANTTTDGTPQGFIEWNGGFTAFPAPSDDSEFRMWTQDLPTLTTAADTSVSVRAEYHPILSEGVASRMAAKEAGHPQQNRLDVSWQNAINNVKKAERKRIRGTGFRMTRIEEMSVTDEYGPVR